MDSTEWTWLNTAAIGLHGLNRVDIAEHSSHRATWTEQTEWTWLNTAAIELHGLNRQWTWLNTAAIGLHGLNKQSGHG